MPFIFEAVFENMAVKQEIFGNLDRICKPGAILASNTSGLDVNEIAAATKRPSDASTRFERSCATATIC